MTAHRCECGKHKNPTPEGLLTLLDVAPYDGQVRCTWCLGVMSAGPFPNTEDAATQQEWLCDLISISDEAFRIHSACIPTPCNGIKTRLVRLATLDGINDLMDSARVGDEYTVYPHTTRELEWGHTSRPGAFIVRQSFWVADSRNGAAGWMPCELFEVKTQ